MRVKDIFAVRSLSCAVNSGSSQVCALYGGQPLTPNSGFLSSVSTLESGVGLASCPWLIDASPGQRINITLYSFTGYSGRGSRPDYDENTCRQRGWSIVIREYNATVSLYSTYMCRIIHVYCTVISSFHITFVCFYPNFSTFNNRFISLIRLWHNDYLN